MGYQKTLVIFIDILGSQNRVEFDELYKINSVFHDENEKNQSNDQEYRAYHRTIYTFSDCSYIFYTFRDGIDESRKNVEKMMNVALYNTSPLILKFLEMGFLCRGGISYGDAYVDEKRSLFFGPAVNKAYKLETVAKYPRILIDEFVADEVLKYNKNLNESDSTGTIATINGKIIFKDQDENYYLNYLNLYQNNPSIETEVLYKDVTKLIDKESAKLESLRVVDIKKYDNIVEKYDWIKRYIETLKSGIDEFHENTDSILNQLRNENI